MPAETLQAVAGLTTTRLALARDAQSRGDLHEADTQVKQILNVERDLKVTPEANECWRSRSTTTNCWSLCKGHVPDAETLEQVPHMAADKVAAGTLVQDGKVFYEMGKFDRSRNQAGRRPPVGPKHHRRLII